MLDETLAEVGHQIFAAQKPHLSEGSSFELSRLSDRSEHRKLFGSPDQPRTVQGFVKAESRCVLP